MVRPSQEYRVIGVNGLTVLFFYRQRGVPFGRSGGGGGARDEVFCTVTLEGHAKHMVYLGGPKNYLDLSKMAK